MAEERKPVSRREFLLNSGVILGILISVGGSLTNAVRFLLPGLGQQQFRRVRVGLVSELEEGKAISRVMGGVPFIIVKRGGEIRAFSSVCTHLGCRVIWKPREQIFLCPCHLGKFDADGRNIEGPPPRPLDEYEVEVKGGNVFVYLPVPQRGGIET